MKNAALIIIDPQHDFVDKTGALYVDGATRDIDNTARFLRNHAVDINHLVITADDHDFLHISHPAFWRDSNGNIPAPFTTITREDFNQKKFTPIGPDFLVKCYLFGLGTPHIIWPVHCLKNTVGASFHPSIVKEVQGWEVLHGKQATVIRKGDQQLSEQHSPFSMANSDLTTNFEEMKRLFDYDTVFFAGEAYSHCLKQTVVDCVRFDMNPKKIVILKNCTSAIKGFDMAEFEKEYKTMGVRFMETGDVV